MFLAHLRGLLKPYYDQGQRSVIAETAMLRALAIEIVASVEGQMLLAEASFAPLLNPSAAQGAYSGITGSFHNVLDKALLDFSRTPQRVRADAAGMVALYTQLERAGFFEKLNIEAEKVLRASGRKRH